MLRKDKLLKNSEKKDISQILYSQEMLFRKFLYYSKKTVIPKDAFSYFRDVVGSKGQII